MAWPYPQVVEISNHHWLNPLMQAWAIVIFLAVLLRNKKYVTANTVIPMSLSFPVCTTVVPMSLLNYINTDQESDYPPKDCTIGMNLD